tara:strand:- start:1791 stop:2783 length:993 start_codon:yes stop_codon:yes gene_type:complete
MSSKLKLNNVKFTGEEDFECLEIWWSLLHKCNYRCKYCYAYDYIRSDIKNNYYHMWKTVIKRLKLKNTPLFKLEILGGEPTLHPNFLDIIEEISKLDKLHESIYYTNLTAPIDFYLKINDLDIKKRIYGGFSYHPQYDKDGKFGNKCVELFKNDLQFYVNVNIINEEKYHEQTANLMKQLLHEGIVFDLNLLQSTKNYEGFNMGNIPKNTIEESKKQMNIVYNFLDKFGLNDFYEKYSIKDKIKYVEKCGKEHYLNELEIRGNHLDNFYNKFYCPAWSWNVDHLGIFKNVCSGEVLDPLFRNCGKEIICPVKGGCTCNSMFKYPKRPIDG